MKNSILIILAIGFLSCQSFEKPTTFIIVRHAEKMQDGSRDPDLTIVGKDRASRLAALVKNATISGIYSTPFIRTKNTVEPIANQKAIEIEEYNPNEHQMFLIQLLEEKKGETVIISGHSNTVPLMVNLLCGSNLEDFTDQEYGHIMIVTASELGNGQLLQLFY